MTKGGIPQTPVMLVSVSACQRSVTASDPTVTPRWLSGLQWTWMTMPLSRSGASGDATRSEVSRL
ncbi:hypothetical protein BDW62DRAFT_178016 [Aspergillus aurantiobrunneus]